MLFVARGVVLWETTQSAKEMSVRIVAIPARLVVHFDPDQYRLRASDQA
jgi:hypothetical protein